MTNVHIQISLTTKSLLKLWLNYLIKFIEDVRFYFKNNNIF